MLRSELKGWHWVISWDNPQPADSSTMLDALSSLGKLTAVQTKTTYILAPRIDVGYQAIRRAIETNLHPSKGNAVYVNLRSGKAFEFGRNTRRIWRMVAGSRRKKNA